MSTYRFPLLERFAKFIITRHLIYLRRIVNKEPAPWTTDKILSAYRFCNVYRELDRTTMWIKERWRDPLNEANNPDLWFYMVIARLVNYPETLNDFDVGRVGWNKKHFLDVMYGRKDAGLQVFSGAYIISTNGEATDKATYLADSVLDPLWKKREFIRPHLGDALQSFFGRLIQYNGMGYFMAAQIIADTKYTRPLQRALDWWTFAASGPGSRRGLNYVVGNDPTSPWREHEWKDVLMELHEQVSPLLINAELPKMHAQDLQNCLCEYSKYRRTEKGTGRPKSRFTPHSE